MNTLQRALVCISILFALASATAGDVTVRLDSSLDMDRAGASLRKALNAWEDASESALPATWTPVALVEGESRSLGGGLFMMLVRSGGDGPEIVVVTEDGPKRAVLKKAEEATVGPVRVLLIKHASGSANVLIRAVGNPVPLKDARDNGAKSSVKITGYERPDRFVVVANDTKALNFAAEVLAQLNNGLSEDKAAQVAWEKHPPQQRGDSLALAPAGAAAGRSYTDRVNMFDDPAADVPYSAMVTLRLVRGEESSLQALSGGASYRSDGATPKDPTIGASANGGGGTVTYGKPGDRFSATLHALEAQGKLNVESEAFFQVPLGGDTSFRIDGPNGGMNGYLRARMVGRQQVELEIDQEGGDWTFLGAVSTRLRFRDGQTIPAAKSTTSRTTSSSSGAPIIGGIPYVGPALGSSTKTKSASSYALYVTVELN